MKQHESHFEEETPLCVKSSTQLEPSNKKNFVDKDYNQWLSAIKGRYRQSQIKASVTVNVEMLQFYWSLGRDIVERKMENRYGSGFFNRLSADLQREIPNTKGFSPTNIKYIKYFYELYSPLYEIRQQLVDELFSIPWGHHVQIISKCKGNAQKALFFVLKTKENNWSRSVLLNFLDTDLYERNGKAITNFKSALPEPNSDLAQQMTKDPYCFDFLTLSQQFSEKELKDALMDSIQKFLLELGSGFAFVGREVRIEVGATEKFIDMLFYNIKLHCYVVLEVKVDKFDFSNVGQLGGYIVAVNHQLKGVNDNPTIGLLVCKYKDSIEAQYALESSSQPIGVSAYQLSKLLPEPFKTSLPSIEELENRLE